MANDSNVKINQLILFNNTHLSLSSKIKYHSHFWPDKNTRAHGLENTLDMPPLGCWYSCVCKLNVSFKIKYGRSASLFRYKHPLFTISSFPTHQKWNSHLKWTICILYFQFIIKKIFNFNKELDILCIQNRTRIRQYRKSQLHFQR